MSRETHSTDIVVLRAVAYGDADQILTLLSRELGRISALARGARKSRKRFGGALGLFTISRAELSRRRGAEMFSMQSAQPERVYLELATDMIMLAHASYATELVRELVRPEHPEPGIFDLLCGLYAVMADRGPSVSLLRGFELGLLGELGLAPMLDACVGCGEEDPAVLDVGAVLDHGRGGVVCARCAPRSVGLGVRMLSGAARRLLVAAQRVVSLDEAHSSADDDPAAAEARDAMMATIAGHVGKPLRSLEFAAKLAQSPDRRPS